MPGSTNLLKKSLSKYQKTSKLQWKINRNWKKNHRRSSAQVFDSHNTIKKKNMPGSTKLLKKSLSNIEKKSHRR